jgi:hypothetical protein
LRSVPERSFVPQRELLALSARIADRSAWLPENRSRIPRPTGRSHGRSLSGEPFSASRLIFSAQKARTTGLKGATTVAVAEANTDSGMGNQSANKE